MKRVVLLAVVVVLLAVTIAFAKSIWWWVELHTGTTPKANPAYYGFWSGFGSDLGEASIVVAIVSGYRHHNCHVHRCPRLGRAVEGTPYVACPRHHPAHHGDKRGVSIHVIHRAHELAHAKEAA